MRRLRSAPAAAPPIPAHGRPPNDVGDVAEDIAARDKSDSSAASRHSSGAADAVYIDTTGLAVEDVVAQVLALVREKAGG